MNYDQFLEEYKPVTNHIDNNAAFDGYMFETFGADVQHVINSPKHNTWTIVATDGNLSVATGYWLVNRIGYFITEKPRAKLFPLIS